MVLQNVVTGRRGFVGWANLLLHIVLLEVIIDRHVCPPSTLHPGISWPCSQAACKARAAAVAEAGWHTISVAASLLSPFPSLFFGRHWLGLHASRQDLDGLGALPLHQHILMGCAFTIWHSMRVHVTASILDTVCECGLLA